MTKKSTFTFTINNYMTFEKFSFIVLADLQKLRQQVKNLL